MGTLVKTIEDKEEIANPNVVKAVFDREGFALYFSRSPIPYYRNNFQGASNDDVNVKSMIMYKHIGIYSYRKDVLLQLTKMPQSDLEKAEKLEQLRALENGYKIKVRETQNETIGVDTPEDLEKVEKWLNSFS